MKTAAFHNLGCKVNAYEMDAMLQDLERRGYKFVPFEEKADVYIVNTCTVTNIADRKSRQMLHKAKKTNPEGIVVAVGCYVQADAEAVADDPAVDLMIGNHKKKNLADILERYLEGVVKEGIEKCTEECMENGVPAVIDANQIREYEEMKLTRTQEHTRACIKIQDGCSQFCSYCIIPYVRGRVRSRRKADILNEIKGLAAAGYQEFVLTGIHISSYGIDFEEGEGKGETLLSLAAAIDKLNGVKRIRLGSLEPRIVTKEFTDGLSRLQHICPHFHLSLQSGCEATLKRMNRHYTPEQFMQGAALLRSAFGHPAITTDVIVGFPGETQEEFEETRQFIEQARFYEMHVFKYSQRKGTKAAVMDNQAPEAVKAERSEILRKLGQAHSQAFRDYYINQEVESLFEEKKEIDGREYWIGHTREYVKTALLPTDAENLSNKLVCGRITRHLNGKIVLMDSENLRNA